MIRVEIPITVVLTVTTLAGGSSALHVDEVVGGTVIASAGVVANYLGNTVKLNYPPYYALADSIARFGASVASAAALQDVLGLSEEYLDYNAEMAAGDVLITLATYGSIPESAPSEAAYVLALTMAVDTLPQTPMTEILLEAATVPIRPVTHWIGLLALSGVALNLVETVDDALGNEMAVPVDEVVFRFDPAWPALQASGYPTPIILGTLYDALGTSLGFAVLLHPNKVPRVLLEPGAIVRALVADVGRAGLSLLRNFL